MIDLIRIRSRKARASAVAVAAMSLLAVGLIATPAFAVPADVESFNPDKPPADSTLDAETMVMSDKADGTDSTFHVTAVADSTTTVVQWFYCPAAYGTGAENDAAVPAYPTSVGCTLAGEDTTGVRPQASAGGPISGSGEAYELAFNVPDDAVHDWVTMACDANPTVVSNCIQDVENDVQFDDAGSGGTPEAQSPAGEITSPTHGSNVSQSGFTVTATTSPEVTSVLFCLAVADEAADPMTCTVEATDTSANNPAAQQSQFKTWSATLTPAANTEYALVLFESAGGNVSPIAAPNNCVDTRDCQLDSHYIFSQPPAVAEIQVAFPDEPGSDNCGSAGAVNTADNATEEYEVVQGCFIDQSGNLQPFSATQHWAFFISPVDPAGDTNDEVGFECRDSGVPAEPCSDTFGNEGAHGGAYGLAEGNQSDPNGDFFYEIVDGDPGQQNTAAAQVAPFNNIAEQTLDFHTAGTYTVTFCIDSNNDAEALGIVPQASNPCAGEAQSATGTKNVSAGVDHVHVKRKSETDALCHTGPSSTTQPAGTPFDLQGCALQITSTGGEQPVSGVHVLWFNERGAADPARILTQENLTDAQGQADASVSSGAGAAGQSSTIIFCVDEYPAASGPGGQNGNGICDADETQPGPFGIGTVPIAPAATKAAFTINWTESAGPGPGPGPQPGDVPVVDFCNRSRPTANLNELLVGTKGGDLICGFGGDDTLRGLNGKDTLRGGSGDDVHNGGPGQDNIRGGAGDDSMRGGRKADTLKGGKGDDTARGGPQNDLCRAEVMRGCENRGGRRR